MAKPKRNEVDEIEYILLTEEWLESLDRDYLNILLRFLSDSGAIIQRYFDTKDCIIVDDKMSDDAVAKLAEMLEGHPVGSRKVRVLKNGQRSNQSKTL